MRSREVVHHVLPDSSGCTHVVHPIAEAGFGYTRDNPHVAVGQASTIEADAERLLHVLELRLGEDRALLRQVVQVPGEAGVGVGHAPRQARLREVPCPNSPQSV